MVDSEKPQPQLRVGAHVLVQLGTELVTDVEQAILECVKNSYDADSPGCKITVDSGAEGAYQMAGSASALLRFDAPAENVSVAFERADGQPFVRDEINGDDILKRNLCYKGSLTIQDSGDGLDEEQLNSSWLIISGSKKRSLGGPKVKTRKGRTPLGDKGVGRLGTMRLGDILVIETAKSPDHDISIAAFRWGDCETADTVDEIPVHVSTRPNLQRFKGTKVSVLGLRDLHEWRGSKRGAAIARSLAKLISPFEATSTFPVSISVDDVDHSLMSVTNDVLSRAVATFEFKWGDDGNGLFNLTAIARFRRSLLAGKKNAAQSDKTLLTFGSDGGKSFHESLSKMSRLRGYNFKPYEEDATWFVELTQTFSWAEIVAGQDKGLANPGPFNGFFSYFHLTDLGDDTGAAAMGLAATKDFIKEMAGITILRDGFRVRSPGDWLNLASGMTSGSTYGLRVDNTLGYFALTGEHNFMLTEKSDREGFVEDAAYRGFLQIARMCRKFASDSMENVRRAVDTFAKAKFTQRKVAQGRVTDPMEHLEQTINDTAAIRDFVEKQVDDLKRDLLTLESSDPTAASEGVTRVASAVVTAMDTIRERLAPTVEQLGSLNQVRENMSEQRNQMISLFESAAVGLSARGLAHEVRTHLTEIRQQTNQIQKAHEQGRQVQPMLRSIRSSCSAIATAASLIDPMLPRARAVKEDITLHAFIEDYLSERRSLLERYGIAANVIRQALPVLRINRSRLLQVIDNLAQNSIYWLQHADTTSSSSSKQIVFVVHEYGFIMWDTGPGVNEKVENSLFEMFVTMKNEEQSGQGLGLFIVTQLLDIDGGRISLSDERNANGRRFKFNVDLSAVLAKGNIA